MQLHIHVCICDVVNKDYLSPPSLFLFREPIKQINSQPLTRVDMHTRSPIDGF